jgi:hypothetical protein
MPRVLIMSLQTKKSQDDKNIIKLKYKQSSNSHITLTKRLLFEKLIFLSPVLVVSKNN